MSDKSVMLSIRIDKDLRSEFKAITARKEETMSDVLVRAINNYVNENKD